MGLFNFNLAKSTSETCVFRLVCGKLNLCVENLEKSVENLEKCVENVNSWAKTLCPCSKVIGENDNGFFGPQLPNPGS